MPYFICMYIVCIHRENDTCERTHNTQKAVCARTRTQFVVRTHSASKENSIKACLEKISRFQFV